MAPRPANKATSFPFPKPPAKVISILTLPFVRSSIFFLRSLFQLEQKHYWVSSAPTSI
jgi:hypothetical protein